MAFRQVVVLNWRIVSRDGCYLSCFHASEGVEAITGGAIDMDWVTNRGCGKYKYDIRWGFIKSTESTISRVYNVSS